MPPDDGIAGPAAPERGLRRPILVSACLLGVRCNHRGEANPSSTVMVLGETHPLVGICPETAGGLPTPRPAAELGPDGRVRTRDGSDVSVAFHRGAEAAVRLARALGAERAILKARSPSCGCHEVYDGTFSRRLVGRRGVAAQALVDAGLEVLSEDDL